MSNRDKWLGAALPAMLTLLIGWVFFLRPAAREAGLAKQRVVNQGSREAREAAIARVRADIDEVQKEVATKRSAPATDERVFDRNWAMQQISLLCAAHNVSLSKSEKEPAPKLPAVLQEASTGLAQKGTPPQVWRVEMAGDYLSVVKLLASLQKAKPLIVPLNLSMKVGKTERHPSEWVLTLWL